MKFSHAISPLIIGTLITIVQPQQAVALSSTEVGKIAEEITVLIDGRAPGSGVIIKKQGNTYTVLTAAHVLKANIKHEIVTPDGQRHSLDKSKVKRLPDIDLAVVEFTSSKNYKTAKIGNSDTSERGTISYLSGFPGKTATVNNSIFYFTEGKMVANSNHSLNSGYALAYTNRTIKGMSGGPILNNKGELIGIHGRGDIRYEELSDTLAKSDFSLGIPINTFVRLARKVGVNIGVSAPSKVANAREAEDFFVKGTHSYKKKDYPGAVADFTEAIKLNPQYAEAYFLRGYARRKLQNRLGSLRDFTKVIEIGPDKDMGYFSRGVTHFKFQHWQGAITDLTQTLRINPNFKMADSAYGYRGFARGKLKDFQGAINDFNQALKINPKLDLVYYYRCLTYDKLGNLENAVNDCSQAIKINPSDPDYYVWRSVFLQKLRKFDAAILDLNKAADIYMKQGKIEDYEEMIKLRDLLYSAVRLSQ